MHGLKENTTQHLPIGLIKKLSDFLCYFLKLLSDPKDANKLTHMLTICMGEDDTSCKGYKQGSAWLMMQTAEVKGL
jgi:hypothetical protein